MARRNTYCGTGKEGKEGDLSSHFSQLLVVVAYEHGPLTAVVVSVPDLYLTLSIHPEVLHPMTQGWNSGCRSSHGNARSCLGDCSLISRKRAAAEAATLLKYTEIIAHNVVVANEL